jgi:hypothetical protein
MVVEVGGIDEQIENISNADCYDKAVKNVPNNKGWCCLEPQGAKVGAAIL